MWGGGGGGGGGREEEEREEGRSGKVSHAREPGDKVECLAQNVYMCV